MSYFIATRSGVIKYIHGGRESIYAVIKTICIKEHIIT